MHRFLLFELATQKGDDIPSNLATVVSRTLQLQDGRIQCPMDRNLEIFLTFHN